MSVDSITDDLFASVVDVVQTQLDSSVSQALIDLIVAAAPNATGQLASQIFVDPWAFDGSTFVSFARALTDYAQYTDEGTGIYGPTGERIYPVASKALHFFGKYGEVFATSIAGQPALNWFQVPMERYFDDALQSLA